MRASRVFAALQRIGWSVKRGAKGSHKVLQREGFPDFVWPSTTASKSDHGCSHGL